eukprot:SAG11_NODE_1244_length_5405_cov_15.009994_2_plen_411_part_00
MSSHESSCVVGARRWIKSVALHYVGTLHCGNHAVYCGTFDTEAEAWDGVRSLAKWLAEVAVRRGAAPPPEAATVLGEFVAVTELGNSSSGIVGTPLSVTGDEGGLTTVRLAAEQSKGLRVLQSTAYRLGTLSVAQARLAAAKKHDRLGRELPPCSPPHLAVVGSHVTWVGADDDIPRGHIGSVISINANGQLRVQFPSGMYKFDPSEIVCRQHRAGPDAGIYGVAVAPAPVLTTQWPGASQHGVTHVELVGYVATLHVGPTAVFCGTHKTAETAEEKLQLVANWLGQVGRTGAPILTEEHRRQLKGIVVEVSAATSVKASVSKPAWRSPYDGDRRVGPTKSRRPNSADPGPSPASYQDVSHWLDVGDDMHRFDSSRRSIKVGGNMAGKAPKEIYSYIQAPGPGAYDVTRF